MKNQCFLGLLSRESNCVVVDYDVANATPVEMVREIAALFDVNIRGHVEVPGHVGAKGHQKARVTANDMSADDLAFIRNNLDLDFEARLGFAQELSA